MNERLKYLRKKNGISQIEFGKRIGIGKTAVSKLETGENKPSEQTIMLICKEFGVNEVWLRTGEGGDDNMFTQSTHDIIDTSNDIKSMIIGAVNIMNDKQLTSLWDYIVKNFTNGGDKVGKTD